MGSRPQPLHYRQKIFYPWLSLLGRASYAPVSTTHYVQPFWPRFKADPFPLPHSLMAIYFKLPCFFNIAELFAHHRLYDFLLEFPGVSLS